MPEIPLGHLNVIIMIKLIYMELVSHNFYWHSLAQLLCNRNFKIVPGVLELYWL